MNATFKTLATATAGFVVGAVAIGATIAATADQVMIQQTTSPLSFEQTVASIEHAVEQKGWKLPKVYRLDKTMEKHGYTVNKVAVMELCHPDHAYKILKDDDSLMVTPFMPCRLSVYQRDDGEVVIARMNSGLMSNLFKTDISQVMGLATSQVEGIIVAATTLSESTIAANCSLPPATALVAEGTAKIARID